MRAVPYLQREGLGVELGRDAVRAVEVVATRGRAVVRWAAEVPVGEGGQAEALARIVERKKLAGRFVHGHVDPGRGEVQVVRVPDFEDAADVWAWLDGQAARADGPAAGRVARAGLLPDAVGAEGDAAGDFTGAGSEAHVGAVVTVPAPEVERALDVLRGAGLGVLRLGTGQAEAATPFVVAEAEVGLDAPEVLLVADGAGATAVEVAGGRVRAVYRLAVPPDLAAAEAQATGGGASRLAVTGPEAASALAAAADVYGDDVRMVALPDDLAPAFALAYGLAVEASAPDLEGLDLLPPEDRERVEAEVEKLTAQRAVLTVALVVLAALVLAEGASWAFAERLARAEAAVASRSEEVAAVEGARADVARLRRDLAAARSSSSELTRVASTLDRVGAAVPAGVWLSGLAVDGAGLVVSGYAADYGGVERTLSALEADPGLQGVRLVRTVRLTPETTADLVQPVVEFEVRAEVRGGGR